jgi:putative membrane protein
VLYVALGTGIHANDGERLTSHMAEHLLIVVAAPPLLLLGEPVRLALLTLPHDAARALARILSGRVVRTLTHPLVAWLMFSVVLVGSHAPVLYDAALRDTGLHALEHALYFWTAMALWQSVLAVAPVPGARSAVTRMLVLMAAAPPMVLLGATFTGLTHVAYSTYAHAMPHAAALVDQNTAGALMWVGGSLPMAVALVAIGWAAVEREEAHAVARERYAERGAAAGGSVP